MADKFKMKSHPLVDKLHPEPDTGADLLALVGYVGPSKKADCVRLYADLSFHRYFEIPTSGIAHTEPADPKAENSPTTVMVLPDTKLEVVETLAQSVEASYLQGRIVTDQLARSDWPDAGAGPVFVAGSVFFSGCAGCRPQPSVGCASRPICTNRLRCPQ